MKLTWIALKVPPVLGFLITGATGYGVPALLPKDMPTIPEPDAPTNKPATTDGQKVASQDSSPDVYGALHSKPAPVAPAWSVSQFVGAQAVHVRTIAAAASATATSAVKAQVAAATRVGAHYYALNQQSSRKATRHQTDRNQASVRSASKDQPRMAGRSVATMGGGRATSHQSASTSRSATRSTFGGGYDGAARGTFGGFGNGAMGHGFNSFGGFRGSGLQRFSFMPSRGGMGGGRHR